ncbi:MAG: hypothetical protein V5A72_03005, partial [Candidatus Nanohaloarchaea archaeon]
MGKGQESIATILSFTTVILLFLLMATFNNLSVSTEAQVVKTRSSTQFEAHSAMNELLETETMKGDVRFKEFKEDTSKEEIEEIISDYNSN